MASTDPIGLAPTGPCQMSRHASGVRILFLGAGTPYRTYRRDPNRRPRRLRDAMLPLTEMSGAPLALNYLLHRQQVSLAQAQDATSAESRIAHRKLADLYATRARAMILTPGATTVIPEVRR